MTDHSPSRTHPPLWAVVGIAILGALVGLSVLVFSQSQNLNISQKIDQLIQPFVPQPETFTELYFENHLELPVEIKATQPFEISLSVHNLEYQPVTYPLRVYAEDAEQTTGEIPLYQTEFTLLHDETKTLPVELTLPMLSTNSATRTKITVELTNLHQTIHFWLNLSPPPPIAP